VLNRSRDQRLRHVRSLSNSKGKQSRKNPTVRSKANRPQVAVRAKAKASLKEYR